VVWLFLRRGARHALATSDFCTVLLRPERSPVQAMYTATIYHTARYSATYPHRKSTNIMGHISLYVYGIPLTLIMPTSYRLQPNNIYNRKRKAKQIGAWAGNKLFFLGATGGEI